MIGWETPSRRGCWLHRWGRGTRANSQITPGSLWTELEHKTASGLALGKGLLFAGGTLDSIQKARAILGRNINPAQNRPSHWKCSSEPSR